MIPFYFDWYTQTNPKETEDDEGGGGGENQEVYLGLHSQTRCEHRCRIVWG